MNKTLALILWPILVLVFVVGWLLYWIGEPRNNALDAQQKKEKKTE